LEKRKKDDAEYRVPDDFNAYPEIRMMLQAMPLMILPDPGPTVTFVDGVYQVTPEIEAGQKIFFLLHCNRLAMRKDHDIRVVLAEERAHGNDRMERYIHYLVRMKELVDQRNAELRDDRTRLEDKRRAVLIDDTTPANAATR
jgi:hypothetical protein